MVVDVSGIQAEGPHGYQKKGTLTCYLHRLQKYNLHYVCSQKHDLEISSF